MPPTAAKEEPNIVVENELYRVEFSNRGAVVKSWQLKKYKDDSKPQRVLDVVHADAATQANLATLRTVAASMAMWASCN